MKLSEAFKILRAEFPNLEWQGYRFVAMPNNEEATEWVILVQQTCPVPSGFHVPVFGTKFIIKQLARRALIEAGIHKNEPGIFGI